MGRGFPFAQNPHFEFDCSNETNWKVLLKRFAERMCYGQPLEVFHFFRSRERNS